jgi:hypothetical protein
VSSVDVASHPRGPRHPDGRARGARPRTQSSPTRSELPMRDRVAVALSAGASSVESRGWRPCRPRPGTGRYCALGGVWSAPPAYARRSNGCARPLSIRRWKGCSHSKGPEDAPDVAAPLTPSPRTVPRAWGPRPSAGPHGLRRSVGFRGEPTAAACVRAPETRRLGCWPRGTPSR